MQTDRVYKKDESGDFIEITNTHQNSTEVGQTSKGEWYVKSVKVYESDAVPMKILMAKMMENAQELCRKKNEGVRE